MAKPEYNLVTIYRLDIGWQGAARAEHISCSTIQFACDSVSRPTFPFYKLPDQQLRDYNSIYVLLYLNPQYNEELYNC